MSDVPSFCPPKGYVHIETKVSLTTDSFINALGRFMSIRGNIELLRSDYHTNKMYTKEGFLRQLNQDKKSLNYQCESYQTSILSQ